MTTSRKQIKKETETKPCSKCKKDKKLVDYYMAANDIINKDGKMCICKSCLSEIIGDNFLDSNLMISTMRMVDRPFLLTVYEDTVNSDKPTFGEYMRRLAMPQNKELTFADSEMERDEENRKTINNKNYKSFLTAEEKLDVQRFWGDGFSDDNYIFLNSEWEDYLNRYEVETKAMENLIKEICLTQLDIRNKRSNGEKVDTQLKTLQDLLGSSNLKPVQETGANAVDQESFGTLIKKFENEHPIPEPDPMWKDVDGIGKYMRIWFLGHLAKMTGKENPYQNEYDEEVKKYRIELDEDYEEDDKI